MHLSPINWWRNCFISSFHFDQDLGHGYIKLHNLFFIRVQNMFILISTSNQRRIMLVSHFFLWISKYYYTRFPCHWKVWFFLYRNIFHFLPATSFRLEFDIGKLIFICMKITCFYINTSYQGSRCRLAMSQFAIFFLDWRLKSASGDLFST